jgi:hypothetical protein
LIARLLTEAPSDEAATEANTAICALAEQRASPPKEAVGE